MQWYEILLIVAAGAFVIGIAVWQIVRKLKGKGGCDCGCGSCSGCSACHSRKDSGKEQK